MTEHESPGNQELLQRLERYFLAVGKISELFVRTVVVPATLGLFSPLVDNSIKDTKMSN